MIYKKSNTKPRAKSFKFSTLCETAAPLVGARSLGKFAWVFRLVLGFLQLSEKRNKLAKPTAAKTAKKSHESFEERSKGFQGPGQVAPSWLKLAPSWSPYGPKLAPSWHKLGPRRPMLIHGRPKLASQTDPKTVQN